MKTKELLLILILVTAGVSLIVSCDDDPVGPPQPEGVTRSYSWEVISTGTDSYLSGVWGTSGNDIFLSGAAGRLLHYDGEACHITLADTTRDFYDIWGASPDNVYAVGSRGMVYRFNGANWSPVASQTNAALQVVWGFSASEVYAAGEAGMVLHFSGAQLMDTRTICPTIISGLCGASGKVHRLIPDTVNNLYAATSSGDFHYNNGISWFSLDSINIGPVLGMWAASWDNVFAAGPNQRLSHFDGQNWRQWTVTDAYIYIDVYGLAANDVFTVALDGTVLHFDGEIWQNLNNPYLKPDSGPYFSSIWVSTDGHVFIAGHEGTLVHGIPQ